MVVKKRSGYDLNEKFALPLVNECDIVSPSTKPLHVPSRGPLGGLEKPSDGVMDPWRLFTSTADELGKSTLVFTAKKRKSSIYSLVLFGFILVGLLVYWHLKLSLRTIMAETEALVLVRNQINVKLRSAEKDIRVLSREVTEEQQETEKQMKEKEEQLQFQMQMTQTANESDDVSRAVSEQMATKKSLVVWEERVRDYQKQTNRLRESVQRYSHDAVLRKFGRGRHLVEVDLDFSDSGDKSLALGPSSFVIEMAPVDIMPHSVYVFLEMVSMGLWDGCSFSMKAADLLMASATPVSEDADGKKEAALGKKFQVRGLNGPTFSEHSPRYPYKLFSVGFASTSGPTLYVNLEDSDAVKRESPFGRIISGIPAIRRLAEVRSESGQFNSRIGIKRAVVL